MSIDHAMSLIKNEKRCVERASTCDRDCAKCDLLRDTDEILEAYDIALNAMFLSELVISDDRR